mgnify:CR=1 FL=1
MATNMDMPPAAAGYPAAWGGPIIPARRTLWSAIFAGAFVATSIELILMTLGVAIGFSAWDGNLTTGAAKGFAIAEGIWWIVSSAISLYIGGWVAGRQSMSRDRSNGGLHGIVAWSFTMFVWLLLAGGAAGTLVRSSARLAGAGVSAAGQTAGGLLGALGSAAASPDLREKARKYLPPHDRSGENEPGVTEEEARRAARQAEEQTVEAARTAAADAIGAAAWVTWASFIMLVISFFTAWGGGAAGSGERTGGEGGERTTTDAPPPQAAPPPKPPPAEPPPPPRKPPEAPPGRQ